VTSLTQFGRLRVGLLLWILALLAFLFFAASLLRAQAAPRLGLLPSITPVGTNDNNCHESVKQLQRLIGEFALVRGHRIYVVCDSAAWQIVLHHLTLAYGVIVNSRAAVSDVRLRETWFYARALRKGAEGHKAEYIYAHELGHFKCSCIDEAAADIAAAQLLDDAHKHRLQAAVSERQRENQVSIDQKAGR
jgi:hypothetical protein